MNEPIATTWVWLRHLAVGTLTLTSADDQRRYDGYAADCMAAFRAAADAARADGWVL